MDKKLVNKLDEFVQYAKQQNTKKAQKILQWLENGKLKGIMVSNKVYWLEPHGIAPKYICKYIDDYMTKQGYKYLYDAIRERKLKNKK